jgi:hypothetical protein
MPAAPEPLAIQGPAALVLLALALAPLLCAVDFAYYRRAARQKPSFAWPFAFGLSWALLVGGAAFHANVLLPIAFLLAGLFSSAWLVKRWRGR